VAGGLTAFKGPLQGALEGKLGIQQPGWHPGMPVTGSGDTTGGSGGFNLPMPFGLPNIEVPQAPPGPQEHPGSGAAPGPTVVQNNDMHVDYSGATIGQDSDEHRRQIQRAPDRGTQGNAPVHNGRGRPAGWDQPGGQLVFIGRLASVRTPRPGCCRSAGCARTSSLPGVAAPRTSALDWNISSATVMTCRRRQTARRGPS